MYQHHITPFGEFQKHTFENSETQNSFSIVPDFGACLLDVVFQSKSVIDGYQTPTELLINKWGKNCVLYPFPNRLKNGQYEWQGQTYQFPINDSSTGNALHGFGMDKKMTVHSVMISDHAAQMICSYSYDGQLPYYPFPFTIQLEFEINNAQEFIVSMGVKNDGTREMPIGWGWHPYFQLAETVDEMALQVPVCEGIEIDQYMIPTGQRERYSDFVTMKKIDSTVLDNGFAIPETIQGSRFEIQLKSGEHLLNYWQETGENYYNFIQLFTPPYRGSIAIEPMTCNIDAFNNKEGLMTLEPEQQIEGSFGFEYRKI